MTPSGPSLLTTPLLERDEERRLLQRALEDAAAGRGRLVVIEGQAGVGKSRLLAEAVAGAAEAGLDVLRGRSNPAERDFPFGVALQLFEPVARATGDERAEVLDGAAAASAQLFDGSAWSRLAQEPTALFALVHALYWLASNLAERRPLLIAVDELRWSDTATLRFLLHLAHRIADLPIALVVALRTGERSSRREEVLALVGQDGALTLRPQPLGAEAVAVVARSAMPGADDEFCAACAEATGGNPFLLCELLLTLEQEGMAPTGATAPAIRAMAPEAVSRSVLLRLARCAPEAVTLGRAIAVLGEEVEVGLAAALAELDPSAAGVLAEELIATGVLAASERLTFAHPLVRSAVLADVGPVERGRLHAGAARLLHARGGGDDVLAAQLVRCPTLGEAWAAAALVRAAAHSMGEGLPAVAARRLERALDEPMAPVERTEAEIALARAELAAGSGQGRERLERVLPSLPARRQAELLHQLGHTLHLQGRPGEAAATFERACELAGDDDDLARELRASHALAAMWDPERAPAALEGAAAVLRAGVEPASLGERALLVAVASADLFAARNREAAVERAWRAWGDGRWLEEAGIADSRVGNLVGVLSFSDAFDRSLAVCERLVEEASAQQLPVAFATAVYLRGILHGQRGALPEAIADLGQSLDAEPLGWEFLAPTARGTLAVAHLHAGDRAAARAVLALDARTAEAAREDYLFAVHWIGRGWLALADGEPAAAAEHFRIASGQLASIGNRNPAMFNWHGGAVAAAVRLGDHAAARAVAEEEVELARGFGGPRALALALRDRALCEPAAADRLPWLDEAAAVAEGSDALLARALVLLDLGAALRRDRGPTAARSPLHAAAEAADRAGAAVVAAQAREELALAGVHLDAPSPAGADALTPGELRVARLAAQGLTNREIAQALFVTRKTVEWHLRGTYRKLGVNDRAALGPLLERRAG